MAAPFLLGDQSKKRCLLASALSFALSFLPLFPSQSWAWIFWPQTACSWIHFLGRSWIRTLCSLSLPPCPHRRATPASPRPSAMSRPPSATSSLLSQQLLVMVQGLRIRSTAFATPLKPQADQSLQRHAVLIRKNTGLRKRNSVCFKKPELSAAPILPGPHHCTWFRSRRVLGAHAAIIADSILQRYTTGTLSRPSWTCPQG